MAETIEADEFDFDAHRDAAREAYSEHAQLYAGFAETLGHLLTDALKHREITVASIMARGKTIDSFCDKAAKPSAEDPNKPLYRDPMREITDMTATRVITFFLDTVDRIDAVIHEEFKVMEKSDKSSLLIEQEKLGYQSVHYLVQLGDSRRNLSEYRRFAALTAEIQVRTILQHAWAEIEHDIQYKSVATLPSSIRRRFLALAGVLEIADREFQAIEVEHERIRADARVRIDRNDYEGLEITADSLQAYLDHRFGPDGRVGPWNYSFLAAVLIDLGFRSIDQLHACIAEYDDDSISRLIYGHRAGQITRFEDVMLAALGERWIEGHPWSEPDDMDWWQPQQLDRLQIIVESGIPVGKYVHILDS